MNDHPRVGVGAIILNKEGRIFLAKRGRKAKNEQGKWEGPGGSVDFGETIRSAIIREIEEEYGMRIKPIKLLDVCDHILPEEKQHWVSPSFLAIVVRGKPTILEPHKCSEIGWFTRKEMKKLNLTETGKHNLAALNKKYPNKLPDLYS